MFLYKIFLQIKVDLTKPTTSSNSEGEMSSFKNHIVTPVNSKGLTDIDVDPCVLAIKDEKDISGSLKKPNQSEIDLIELQGKDVESSPQNPIPQFNIETTSRLAVSNEREQSSNSNKMLGINLSLTISILLIGLILFFIYNFVTHKTFRSLGFMMNVFVFFLPPYWLLIEEDAKTYAKMKFRQVKSLFRY